METINDITKGDYINTPEYGFNTIEVVTEKAFMITVDTSSWVNVSAKVIWIPKSICNVHITKPSKGIGNDPNKTVFYLKDLPDWFFKNNAI